MGSLRMVLGLALLGLFCLPLPTQAHQRLSGVVVGDRVQARMGDERIRGLIEGVTEDALEIRDDSGEGIRTLDLSALERLRVHRGTKRGTKRGLVLGVVGGVLIGAVHGSSNSLCTACSGDAAGVEMILFGILGAPIGALVGSRISVDVWERVSLDTRVSRAPGVGGGLRIGASISTRKD